MKQAKSFIKTFWYSCKCFSYICKL